jgi:signal transduction histidine kinase
MLNLDQDLHITSDRQTRSRWHSPSTGESLAPSQIVNELSIEQSQAMPIFTEATALATRLADAPVAILTAIAGSGYQIGAISGLEQLVALPERPNLHLELAGLEYCHDRTISSDSGSLVTDFRQHPQLSQSSLLRVHGLQAYLGLPIITAAGDRLGTISILDFSARQFGDREIDILRLVSRLVASEFERKLLSQAQLNHWIGNLQYRSTPGFDDPHTAADFVATLNSPVTSPKSPAPQFQGEIQCKLLTHLAQELRTPLTSVLGMASVLQQEIYGTLTAKQKDYLGIIHHSGRQLVSLVDEISLLGGFVGGAKDEHPQPHQLTLRSVDLEMLCQLALQSLEPLAQKKQQKIKLDLVKSPARVGGNNADASMWLLDKDKVRQIIYYLSLSLIHASAIERKISIRVAKLSDTLQIQIVTNDSQVVLPALDVPALDLNTTDLDLNLRISLGLSLSQSLAASHSGKINPIANGCGYQLTLPLLVVTDPNT